MKNNELKIILSLVIVTLWSIFSNAKMLAFAETWQKNYSSYYSGTPHQESPPRLYNEYIKKGLSFMEQTDYERAEYAFLKAIDLSPDTADAYINIAVIRIKKDDLQTAMELLYEAENIASGDYPKKNILLYNLGLCSYLQGNYKDSIEYFSRILESNPYFAEALYNRGLCYQNMGQKAKALANIRKAKHLFGKTNNTEYLKKAERALGLLQEKETVYFTSTAYKLPPSDKLLEAGSKKFKDKNTGQAIKLIKESILSDPNNAKAHYRLGTIYAREGKFPRAIVSFRKTIEIDSRFTKAYVNLGIVYGKLKKYKQALALLKKALKMDKRNPRIYYNIATTCLASGNKKSAIKYFKKAKALSLKYNDSQLLAKIDKFL